MQTKNFRPPFIKNIFFFVELAKKIQGVKKIAIIGSITTSKKKPKDIDLLVTIDNTINIKKLAAAGRKLTGKQMAVGDSSGADVFLANEAGAYLGRTCHYRQCHLRMGCMGIRCNGGHIMYDLHIINLDKSLVLNPPVEIYPKVVIRKQLPKDLEVAIQAYQKSSE